MLISVALGAAVLICVLGYDDGGNESRQKTEYE